MLLLLTMLQVKTADQWAKIRTNEDGATAVEYGIMVALIAAVIIATVVLIGTKLNAAFVKVETKLPT